MFSTARNPLTELYDGVPGTSTLRARTPGYFDGAYQSGTLPTLPPSTSRPGSAKVAAVKREIALGNYELARRQASVAEYNNPLDALQTELAIAAQEKVLQEEEEREARRARRRERKLAKALRRMRLEEGGSVNRSRSQSRSRSSRKATPYASEASASECESEDHSPASTRQQSHSHDRQTRHRSRSLDPGAHAPEEDDIAAAARARAQTLHVELENQDLNDRYLPQASTSRLAPNHPSKYALDDHLAQESTLENPEAVKSDERKSRTSTHPSDKKPQHIEYALRSEERANTPAPSAPVLRLVFPSSQEAILTYSEILRGGPSNSFLNSWKQFPGRLDEGEHLTIQMPEGRDASLFKVIHAYLQGKAVIPLSPQLARLLCGSYTPNKSAYKRLYKEAGVYGIKGLMEEIYSFRKRSNGNSASSSGSYKRSRLEDEYRTESESHRAMRTEPNDSENSPTRIVMTGAAMK